MKHISEFLNVRRQQLERQRQLSLFSVQAEKGSSEWSAFNSVRGDRVDSYPVSMPKQAIVITEPHRVLPARRKLGAGGRIMYPRIRTAYGS